MTGPVRVGEAAVQAIARFLIGFGTEQDETWRDYNLDFAGTPDYGKDGVPTAFHPVGDSGYSLGSLQWDFGQQPALAAPFIDAFVRWSAANPGQPTLASDPGSAKRSLALKGKALSASPADGLRLGDVAALSNFVRSDVGSAWVNQNIDENLIGSDARAHIVVKGTNSGRTLVAVARDVEASPACQAFATHGKTGGRDMLLAIGMKTYNQSPATLLKLLDFLKQERTPDNVAGWYKQFTGGLYSGVKAATELSAFWAGWAAANDGPLRQELETAMQDGAMANPADAAKAGGTYVMAKQVFEDTALFSQYAAAAAAGKDFVAKPLFNAATGAIALHPKTMRLKPGMLILKGRHYVWNAAGSAYSRDGAAWTPVPAASINLRKL